MPLNFAQGIEYVSCVIVVVAEKNCLRYLNGWNYFWKTLTKSAKHKHVTKESEILFSFSLEKYKEPFRDPKWRRQKEFRFLGLSSHAFGRLTCYAPANLVTARFGLVLVGTVQRPLFELCLLLLLLAKLLLFSFFFNSLNEFVLQDSEHSSYVCSPKHA